MKIAIDISPLSNAHKIRGTGVYTRLLIEALQRYENQHTYYFITRGYKVPDNVDIVHYPYFDPFFLTLPLYKPFPTVVTVHDLIPLVFPDKFPAGLRGNVKWQVQKISLNGVSRIIADSENSKKDIVSIVGINAQKVDVVYLAPPEVFRVILNKTQLDLIQKKYRLPERFILYVGDVNWNKNVERLMRAFAFLLRTVFLKGQSFRDMKLVLVGKAFFDATLKETQQINSFIDKAGLNEAVIKIGGVSMEDLVAIYNLASVYAQPSLYEGFGLPVLEAMASGCVVVTSGASSLSEIAGPAIRIDPYIIESMQKGIVKALALPQKEHEYLVKDQLEWVKRFSWEKVARDTVAAYKKVRKN